MKEFFENLIDNWKISDWHERAITTVLFICIIILCCLVCSMIVSICTLFANKHKVEKQFVYKEPQLNMQVEIGGKLRTVYKVEIEGNEYYLVKGFSIIKCE